MPNVAIPGGGGGPSPAQVNSILQNILTVAIQNFGAAYSEGSNRLGPGHFDCSSYVWYAYLHGSGLDIGNTTEAQLTKGVGSLVSPSQPNLFNPSGGPGYTYADLQPGDLIYWGNSYNDVHSQHVEMFAGQSITYNGVIYGNSSSTPVAVGEYVPGDVARPSILGVNPNGTLRGDGIAPVLAVLRFQSAILNSFGTAQQFSQSLTQFEQNLSLTPIGTSGGDIQAQELATNFTDPRNNLPFSSYFLAGNTNFMGFTGVSPLFSERHLIRGGIAQSAAQAGGRFSCYFMMNPQTVSVSYNLDTAPLAQMNTQAANTAPAGTANAATISFEVVFNRMYEVWRGDTPGPSDIGCRWDIRALERLIGVYDNTDTSNPTGVHGKGNYTPLLQGVQLVLGSQNSVIFNGYISSLDYEYTLFSKDMVPIEARADLSLLAVWVKDIGKDIINSITNVPSNYYTPVGAGTPQVDNSGPLRGFLGVSS